MGMQGQNSKRFRTNSFDDWIFQKQAPELAEKQNIDI